MLLILRNVLDKSYRGNQNTHLMFNNFFSENHIIYDVLSKNVVQLERPEMSSQYGKCALHAG